MCLGIRNLDERIKGQNSLWDNFQRQVFEIEIHMSHHESTINGEPQGIAGSHAASLCGPHEMRGMLQ